MGDRVDRIERLADRLRAADPSLVVETRSEREAIEGDAECIVQVDCDGTEFESLDDVRPPVVVCSERPTAAAEAFEAGADDFVRIDGTGPFGRVLANRIENVVASVRAKSDLSAARRQIDTERHRLDQLFDHLPDPAVSVEYVDGEPIVRSVNEAFTDVFGYEQAELVGSSLNGFVVDHDDRDVRTDLDARLANGELVVDEVTRGTDHGRREFLLRGIPHETEESRAFVIYTDVTELRRRGKRLRVLNRVLRHNVRNQITVVNGYAELLLEEHAGTPTEEKARKLREAGLNIDRISNTARDVERVLQGNGRGVVEVVTIVESVADHFAVQYPEANVTTDVPDELYLRAGDRLREALEHAVENAIVHHDGERPQVEIGVDRTAGDDAEVELRVVDDGPGIPPEEKNVVLEDAEVTQLDHGSGLGLWVVKWVAEAYGGRVRFNGNDRGGTTVGITLELARAERQGSADLSDERWAVSGSGDPTR